MRCRSRDCVPFSVRTPARQRARFGIRAVVGVHADTHAHRDVQILVIDAVWSAQRSDYLLCAEGCVFRARHLREQKHEFR